MHEDSEIFAALRLELDHGDERLWRPDEGDMLLGYVIDVSTESGLIRGNIEEYPVLRLREYEQEQVWIVRGQARSLRSQLAGLQPGDRVRVSYHGKDTNASGDEWHRYEVRIGTPGLLGQTAARHEPPPKGFPIYRPNSEAAADAVVPCPSCHADVGRLYVSRTGGKVATHASRRRAVRKLRDSPTAQ